MALIQFMANNTPAMLDVETLHRLAELSPGDPAFFNTLTDAFVGTAKESLSRLTSAVAAQDQTALADAAHYFRGACLNMGAVRLTQTCGKLEVRHSGVVWTEAQDQLSALREELDATLDQLSTFAKTSIR